MYDVEPLRNWSEFTYFKPIELLSRDVGEFPDYILLTGRNAALHFELMEHLYEVFAVSLFNLVLLDHVDSDTERAFELVLKGSKKTLGKLVRAPGVSPLFVRAEEITREVEEIADSTFKFLVDTVISLILVDIAIGELRNEPLIQPDQTAKNVRFKKAAQLTTEALVISWRASRALQTIVTDTHREHFDLQVSNLKGVQSSGGVARAKLYAPAKKWLREHDDKTKWPNATKAARNLMNDLWKFLEARGQQDLISGDNFEVTIAKWIREQRKSKQR